jgi:mono/diheme cytochrome c family protein
VDLCVDALRREVAAALALCAGAALGQTEVTPADVEAGRKVYTSYCARCHGINLVSTSGAYFDLRTFPSNDKERFIRSLREGKRAMPAWEGIVKPQEMELLWTYIGSVNGWAADAPPKQ